jgi:predicted nucleic acid-binding protein
MRLFLDTNVMLDYIGKRGEEEMPSRHLHIVQMFRDAEFYVSAKSYTDVFYVANHFTQSQELQQRILQSLEVYSVCSIDAQDIAAACQWGWDDFEDALIAIAAEKCGADYLITNDADFEGGRVPRLTPQGFLDLMREHGITYTAMDLNEIDAA